MATVSFASFTDDELQEHQNYVFRQSILQLHELGIIKDDQIKEIFEHYAVVLVRPGWFRGLCNSLFSTEHKKSGDAMLIRVVRMV